MKARFIIKQKVDLPTLIRVEAKVIKEPRNYQVISFQNQRPPNNIYTLGDDGNYHGLSGCSIPFHNCFDNYRIYSVKRLSDGVIFTVGDNVFLGSNSDKILSLSHIKSTMNDQDIAFATFSGAHVNTNIRDIQHFITITRVPESTKKKVNALFIGKKYM